jgi:uncharacterized protein DUF4154
MITTSFRRRALLAIATAGLLAAVAPCAWTRPPTDHEVKAAFLLHFTRLIDWPAVAPEEPFVVAVLGNDPFAEVLESVAGRDAKKRLRIVRYESLDRITARPQVLFVGTDNAAEARRACAAMANAPVLTVSDLPGFAQGGGMIGFRLTDDGRVAFDVNVARSQAAGLRISSQLLKVARVVEARR